MISHPRVEHRAIGRGSVWALVTLFLAGCVLQAQDIDRSRLQALKTYRTVSRRFVVVGPQTLDNIQAGRWTEDVTDRLEDLLGMSIPFGQREICIVIRPSASATGVVDQAACGPLALTQRLKEHRLVQRLVVPMADCLAVEPVRAAFCRLLLEGFFPSSRPTTRRPRVQPVDVPRWLTVGLARNLTREQRADDARRVLDRWQKGQIFPLADWLERDPKTWAPASDGPVCGVLVAWLLRPPGGQERMKQLFAHLNKRMPVTAARCIALWADVSSEADLEIAWDAWIMRQRHKVFLPGTTPSKAIERLAAELLLYPGGFGIPLAGGIRGGDGFVELIPQRDADWMAAYCRAKQAALQVLAVGRGAGFHEVVDRYGEFLVALAEGKHPSRLASLLDAAESAMRDLTTAGGMASPAEASEADNGNTDTQDIGR